MNIAYILQTFVIFAVGAAILYVFHRVGNVLRTFEDHHDYQSTIASGSRDPRTKMESLKQQRELNRNRATFVVVAILIILLLWRSRN